MNTARLALAKCHMVALDVRSAKPAEMKRRAATGR